MSRTTSVLLAPVLLVALAAPAAAQPSGPAPCPYVDLDVSSSGRVGATTTIRATVGGGDASRPVTVRLTRTSPGPVAVVRESTGTARVVTWTAVLGETHRFAAEATDGSSGCTPTPEGEQARDTSEVQVAPDLTISARRDGVRDYTFSGRVLPGRGQTVDLYRFEHDTGRRVLTSRTVVRPDGTYVIDRRFTGSGRFGFLVSVAESSTNAAGDSRVRPTVIH